MKDVPASKYSGKLRVRAAGLLLTDDGLLLVELRSPVSNKLIWTPPGGGVEFGEPIRETLKREYKEETGLEIVVEELVHINEFIQSEFHAIEFFFKVSTIGGTMNLGNDPEYTSEDQILKQLAYFKQEDLSDIDIKPVFLKKDFWDSKFGGLLQKVRDVEG